MSELLLQLSSGDEADASEGLHRLIPIRNALQQFEGHVEQLAAVLVELLSSDEDMLALLLTARAAAARAGEPLPAERHEQVELLLENYPRRLQSTSRALAALRHRLVSTQELTSISLDMYRNRIIRMELNITMAGCAIAMTTAVAGLFGMNVPIPLGLDRDAGAFALVSGASLLLGAGAFGVAYGVVHQGWWGRGRRIDDIHALHCLLEDMSAIEFTLASLAQPRAARRLAAERGAVLPSPRNVRVMRSEFKQLLASETGRDVSDREVDLVFDLFDKDESRTLEVGELHEYLEAGRAGRHGERRSSFSTPYHDGIDRRTSFTTP